MWESISAFYTANEVQILRGLLVSFVVFVLVDAIWKSGVQRRLTDLENKRRS